MNFYFKIIITGFYLLLVVIIPLQVKAQQSVITTHETNPISTDTILRKQTFQDRVLNNIKRQSKKKTLIGRGLDVLFDFDQKAHATGRNPELLSNAFEKHNYKIVRRIDFRRLNSFGYSITDTTRVPKNFIEKAGNSIHIKTHRGRIRGKLLFKKGAPLEPLALSESERLLRQAEYILDSRVLVNEKTSTADSVDVIVVTKDVFSLRGAAAFNTKGAGRLGLEDINFLGLGHQFKNTYQFGLDSISRTWTYSGSYQIDNIYNTYASAQLIYRNEINYKQQGINITRDFYTTNTKYAGALNINSYAFPIRFLNSEGVRERFNLAYTAQDYWLGKSFKLKSYELGHENRSRIITAGRLIATTYQQSPNTDYQNNILYLGGLGYSFRKYYRDQYLFGFGRTEDIPAGTLIAFTGGYENGKFYNRHYVGGKMAFGKYSTNFGYLYVDAQYDSFIRNKSWEQGEFSSEVLYFTKLLSVGTWQWRHFIWNRTSWGVNRKYGENILNISRGEGIRGFRSPQSGTRKFVMNYESSLFTPFSFLGFRLALVNFVDIAWLSDGNRSNPFKTLPTQGYGLGIRFRNEYMAFSTIQVLFGYYPQGTTPIRNYVSTRPFYDFNDFRFSQPITADFR